MGGVGCMGENRQGRKRLKARRGNGWVILSMGVIATQTKEEWQLIKQLFQDGKHTIEAVEFCP
jgi:hypothetical protein